MYNDIISHGRRHCMLFRKDIPRSCSYCVYGTAVSEDQILCSKCGIVSVLYQCRKFRYDPCKRIPSKMKSPDFSKYNEEDFSL